MNIGNEIIRLRKSMGLSQEELGEKIGVARQTISKWELNETSPDLKQACELSKIFKVSLDELVGNDVKDILVNKISNTERLAGLVLKILKWLGIFLIIYFILMIVGIIFYTTFNKRTNIKTYEEVSVNCHINDQKYQIKMDRAGGFQCDNCSNEMRNNLTAKFNSSNLDNSLKEIENYFKNNNGFCE